MKHKNHHETQSRLRLSIIQEDESNTIRLSLSDRRMHSIHLLSAVYTCLLLYDTGHQELTKPRHIVPVMKLLMLRQYCLKLRWKFF